ncbi:MAG: VWA domain-containing protein [Dehalococcoidia bacterium]|nr:VWA domain-containing protein [Dehalococcoidia bacterium]
MRLYRYLKWDGTQEVFAPDSERLMGELADDLMGYGDVQRALRELLQRGMRGEQGERLMGLRDMLERLRTRRQEQLERYNLDSVMDDLCAKLEDVVKSERTGIDRRLQEAAQRGREAPRDSPSVQEPDSRGKESQWQAGSKKAEPNGQPGREGESGTQQPSGTVGKEPSSAERQRLLQNLQDRARKSRETLDGLPSSLPGAINTLSQYEFMDPEAARKFQELMDLLKGRMMDSMFQNLRQSLQNMAPQQQERLREMLRSLNKMLQEKARGGEPDFGGFLQQFGDMFGPNPPKSLEELLEQMAQQMSGMQSLLDSLSPGQRNELEELLESALDPDTRAEMEELAATLQDFLPADALGKEYRFLGNEAVDLEQATDLMQDLHQMDELEEELREIIRRGNVEDLDLETLERLLGDDVRRNAEALQKLAEQLEQAGYLQRKGQRLELTAKGIRKIGQRALHEVFEELRKERLGRHNLVQRGTGGDFTGETRPFVFGDSFDLALEKTVFNAVLRTGPGKPVRLTPKDFEVHQPETVTQAATAILLDQSRSMGLFGSFQAAKKVTLALQSLIQTHFPRDVLYIIGFSNYATEIKLEEMPQVSWNAWMSGTNIHHALMLSRKLLNRHKGATKQVLMITDGEPTAHLENARAFFNYPPSYRTIVETLKEVRRCTQEGITINTFMLETNHDLLDFVDKLTKINRGRAFYTTPDNLGHYVLVDYVRNRKKRLAS